MTRVYSPSGYHHPSPRSPKRRKNHEKDSRETNIKTSPGVQSLKELESDILQDLGRSSIRRVALFCLTTSVILAVIVIFLLFFQMNSKTILNVDYTQCLQLGSDSTCHDHIDRLMSTERPVDTPCFCRISFELELDEVVSQINVYYGLGNYYQNYRFLAQSLNPLQLSGRLNSTPQRECQPDKTQDNHTILPCGSLANTMFDDDFRLVKQNLTFNMVKNDIVLKGARKRLYKNPDNLEDVRSRFVSPPRWYKSLWNLDAFNQANNGLENGHFINWMKVAMFGDFLKLYAIIRSNTGQLRLARGIYSLDIDYRYGVFKYGGRKYVRLEKLGLAGMKNNTFIVSLSLLSLVYFSMSIVITFFFWKQWVYLVQGPVHVP